jgi:hypothetical protein
MKWINVDTQTELDKLNSLFFWEDCDTAEYYASTSNYDFMPTDISRSGYSEKNLFLISSVSSKEYNYIQIGFLFCEKFDSDFLENLNFDGHVDKLKRIKIWEYDNLKLSCARIVYRCINENHTLNDLTEFYKGIMIE